MDVLHAGNWPPVGLMQLRSGQDVQLFECPVCFALTREPIDHAHHHLKYRQASTRKSA